MATRYVDSNWNGATTGESSSPFNSLSQLASVIANGDTIALKCGSVFRETMESEAIEKDNLRIVTYGSGARPKIVGSDPVTDWTYDATYDVYSTNLGSNVGGNLTENGVPLSFVAWTTNLATTSALMTAGSFSFDYNNFDLYVKPAYRIDDEFEAGCRLYGIDGLPDSFHSGFYLEGIEVVGATRQGIWLHNRGPFEVVDIVVRIIGGKRDTSFHLGNGIEINRGSSGGIVRDSLFEDIFDSAISPQVYDPSAYLLQGATVKNNVMRRCGMGGVEVSSQTADNAITSVQVTHNYAEDIGMNNWSGDRGGTAYWSANNGGTGSCITGTFFGYNRAKRCKRGYLSGNSYGRNQCVGNFFEECERAFYTSKSIAASKEQRDVIVGNIVKNCDVGHYQAGSQAQYTEIFNNTFINVGVGISLPSNASAVVTARNNAFVGTGTAFSVVTGTLTETSNILDTTITAGKTLDGTDEVASLSAHIDEFGRLARTQSNPLIGSGEVISGADSLPDFYGKSQKSPPDCGAIQQDDLRSTMTRSNATRSVATRRITSRRALAL